MGSLMGAGTRKMPRDMVHLFMRYGTRKGKSESNIERDALSQLHLPAEVDGGGLAAHVGLPGVGPAFAAAAGLLLAAKGAADLGAAGARVHVGDAAIAARSRQEQLALPLVVGDDGAGEALGYTVLEGDGLLEGAVGHDVEQGHEGLLLNDGQVPAHFRDAGRDVAAARLGQLLAADEDLAALGLHGLDGR